MIDELKSTEEDKKSSNVAIPTSSFTAFRLRYCTPRQIQKNDKVVFIGTIPNIWISNRQFYGWATRINPTDKKMRKLLRSLTKFESSLNNGSGGEVKASVAKNESPSVNKDKFERPSYKLDEETSNNSTVNGPNFDLEPKQIEPVTPCKPRLRFKTPRKKHQSSLHIAKELAPEPLKDGEQEIGTIRPLKNAHKEKVLSKMKRSSYFKAKTWKADMQEGEREIRKKLFGRYLKGEMVKIQKMIVMVETTSTYVEEVNEASSFQSRVLERWKEYLVVARSTGDIDKPLNIEFYTNRDINRYEQKIASDKDRRRRNKQLDFVLDTRVCTTNFFSTLDKSISITVPIEEGTKIYFFKSHSQFGSFSWYLFIQEAMGTSVSNNINVSIPDLDLSLEIFTDEDYYDELLDARGETLNLLYCEKGYKNMNSKSINYFIDLILMKLKELKDKFCKILDWLKKSESHKLGLAWRLYDRLEWLRDGDLNILHINQVLGKSHCLELRIIQQYPTSTLNYLANLIPEPSPIEGFLHKSTNSIGKRDTTFFKREVRALKYFYTKNNLLLFCPYFYALPPLSDLYIDRHCKGRDELIKISKTLLEETTASRFSIDSKDHIHWLKPGITKEEFKENDSLAVAELERQSYLTLKAQGLINLATVKEVCPRENDELHFELELYKGGKIVLRAESLSVRKIWVSRLTELAEYWKLREREDLEVVKYVRDVNTERLGIGFDIEADFVEKASQWELNKAIASPRVFHMNSVSLLRTLIYSGTLYRKPRKHSNFDKYYVVLSPGYLLLFQMFKRTALHQTAPFVEFQHHSSISLKACYLYSGRLTAMDLLNRDRNFDSMNPGQHASPRVYLDGWKSSEDESLRCFTLWLGGKKLVRNVVRKVSKHTNEDLEDSAIRKGKALLNSVSRLGTEGRTMVFMARSRQEKDLWTTNIMNEMDRFREFAEDEEVHIT